MDRPRRHGSGGRTPALLPQSNHIDPYRFSDGSMHVLEAEMPKWCDYMAEQVDRRGLQEERFLARKGDLFIWSALLLHGGSEIANPALHDRASSPTTGPKRIARPNLGTPARSLGLVDLQATIAGAR